MPLVSVIVPTYKGARFLPDTLGRVFAQTFEDFEVVVINDGSPDDSLIVLEAMREQHGDRLRIITQPNSGIGAARNRGVEEANGRYVAFLDHDDLWMPTKLAEQVRFMQTHENCAACGVLYALSPEPDRPHFNLTDVADSQGFVARPFWHTIKGRDVFLTSTLMIDAQKAAGIRYGTERGAIEDVQFQIKLMARGTYGIAGHTILTEYTLHAHNASKDASFYFEGIKLLRRLHRTGEFAGLPADQNNDMIAWLAHIGRVATIRQIGLNQRLHGAELYLREFFWQIRDCRAKFLIACPLMLLTPSRWINRAYEMKFRRARSG